MPEEPGYRWYVVEPISGDLLFFSVNGGNVHLEDNTHSKLVEWLDFDRLEFRDGFLHLYTHSSHLDFKAWRDGRAFDEEELESPRSVDRGTHFIENYLGLLYFDLLPDDKLKFGRVSYAALQDLGPFSDIRITEDKRLWLRLVRVPLHLDRVYLIQRSTIW
jgi:hypothetical protein